MIGYLDVFNLFGFKNLKILMPVLPGWEQRREWWSISRRHAIVSNFLLRRHAGAGTWDTDLGGLDCDQKKRVRWKIADGKTWHVLRMAACTTEILRNRADRGRSPHIERLVAMVRSKSRSPYIFMGLRPVEGSPKSSKNKSTIFAVILMYLSVSFVFSSSVSVLACQVQRSQC